MKHKKTNVALAHVIIMKMTKSSKLKHSVDTLFGCLERVRFLGDKRYENASILNLVIKRRIPKKFGYLNENNDSERKWMEFISAGIKLAVNLEGYQGDIWVLLQKTLYFNRNKNSCKHKRTLNSPWIKSFALWCHFKLYIFLTTSFTEKILAWLFVVSIVDDSCPLILLVNSLVGTWPWNSFPLVLILILFQETTLYGL